MSDDKPLTVRQARLLEGVLAGRSLADAAIAAAPPGTYADRRSASNSASRLLGSAEVRLAMQAALSNAGVTPEALSTVVADALRATRTLFPGGDGAPITEPDYRTRLRAFELAARVQGAFAPREIKEERTTVNMGLIHLPAKLPRATPPSDAIEAASRGVGEGSR